MKKRRREQEEAAAPRGPPQVTPKASNPFEDEDDDEPAVPEIEEEKVDLSMEWIQELPGRPGCLYCPEGL